MSGVWPHDLLAIGGALCLATGFVWAGLPRRKRHR
jgi:hypothetical protein